MVSVSAGIIEPCLPSTLTVSSSTRYDLPFRCNALCSSGVMCDGVVWCDVIWRSVVVQYCDVMCCDGGESYYEHDVNWQRMINLE